ncbi:MAG TPA: hypothetical protein DHV36_04425 [Desulfobacteraceae bacterium]|nr:hypothetical protein [Desulfobacteraceae bacterium]|tara:strand:- start:773 stop:1024 length:252 start_codon:yes stop_codon:yes gene_type:complete
MFWWQNNCQPVNSLYSADNHDECDLKGASPFDAMSLLQLGQLIRSVLICPLNKRFWQYGQKYQVAKFSVSSIIFKNNLLMVSL